MFFNSVFLVLGRLINLKAAFLLSFIKLRETGTLRALMPYAFSTDYRPDAKGEDDFYSYVVELEKHSNATSMKNVRLQALGCYASSLCHATTLLCCKGEENFFHML